MLITNSCCGRRLLKYVHVVSFMDDSWEIGNVGREEAGWRID